MMRPLFLGSLLLALAACNGPEDTDTDLGPAPSGPELSWTDQPGDTLVEGTPLLVSIEATDDDGVDDITVYFRTEGSRTFDSLALEAGETEGSWSVEIPAESVQAPGLEIYFKGEDTLSDVTFLPESGLQAPILVPVRRIGLSLPYSQDFEDVPNDDLRTINWSEDSLAFQGYEWRRTVSRGFSGEASLVHRRTPSTVNNDIEDWLISPPLDLTSLPTAQVSWMEFGDQADLSDHSLWISTGSPDPTDGEYELVADLTPPPEGEWGRSDTLDLTAYSDAPAAYLAWVYKGRQADVWWVDDVSVRALAPDLRIDDVAWTPDPLSPGDAGTLTLTVSNRTTVAASDVEVVVVADDDVTFSDVSNVASIAGEGSVEVEVPLTVDGDALDNSWVELDISLSTAEDTWTYDERMLIGEPSTLNLEYILDPVSEDDPAQLVRLTLGVGDPQDPVYEVPLASELQSSGTYTLEIDVTDQAEFLPPLPGPNRWYIRFENGPAGSLEQFDIAYGGEIYDTTDLGAFFGFAPTEFFLPRPPEPTVLRQSSTPTPIGPGDSVSWSVDFRNIGEVTSGVTTVSIATDDPGVTITDAGPKELAGELGWPAFVVTTETFAFDVAGDRKSSIPVRMIATVEDEFETFEVPIDVQVPWPVVSVTGIAIDDEDEGNADGLLDPDETATLTLDVTNVGGLATFGATTCSLAQTGGTATATVPTGSTFVGIISGGSTRDEDFDVTVTAGAKGDDLQLTLTCTDRDETYVSNFEVVLGERPWTTISPNDDATGDNRDDYEFDFVNGRYRSDGETLQIQLVSAKDHGGLSGLFIEAWGNSAGGEYTFLNFVAAGSSGTLRGYRGSFFPLGSFTVSEVDARTIQLDIPLEPLGLREGVDAINLGFGAGFCGGTEQFCDHFPDGWGAPYTGLNSSRWTTLDW